MPCEKLSPYELGALLFEVDAVRTDDDREVRVEREDPIADVTVLWFEHDGQERAFRIVGPADLDLDTHRVRVDLEDEVDGLKVSATLKLAATDPHEFGKTLDRVRERVIRYGLGTTATASSERELEDHEEDADDA